MSESTFRRWKRNFLGAAIVVGVATLVGFKAFASEQAAARDDPSQQAAARRAKFLSIAEPLLARRDKVQDLKDKLAELSVSTARAAAELKQAEASVEVAKVALNKKVAAPITADVQKADEELAAARADMARAKDRKAWADKMLKKGAISDSQHLADAFALQKAQFTAKQAEAKREVLERHTKGTEVAILKRSIQDAEESVADKKALALPAKTKLPALEQQIQEESFTPGETQVLVLLDQAAELDDRRESEQAEAKMDEAGRLAQTEQSRRNDLKYKSVMRRVRKRVEELKGAPQAPARVEPAAPAEALRDKVQTIAETILTRFDKRSELLDQRTTLKIAARKAEAEAKQAALSLEVTKISVDEYINGTSPSDIQTADGELLLAKSNLQRAKDLNADTGALQKAEAAVEAAKTKRKLLDKSIPKEEASLKADVKRAEESLAQCNLRQTEADARLLALDQRVKQISPTPGEVQVLELIDAAGQLEDKGQSKAADAKFHEAIRLWQVEKAHGGEVMYKELLRRVRAAVEEMKGTSKPH